MTANSTDLLLLGAGWTSTFLLPLLSSRSIPHVATTRDGRSKTLKWAWDPNADAEEQCRSLPSAKTVVISFPIKGKGESRHLVKGYEKVHGKVKWIQLGSSGIWDGGPTLGVDEKKGHFKWTTRHSSYNKYNDRAAAEDELLASSSNAYILNLCGLWGGARDPLNWLTRVAPTKAALSGKTSVHLIHGSDVSLAILAVHLSSSPKLSGRWLLTDLRVYDWYDMALTLPQGKGEELEQAKWVRELMQEEDIRALPRSVEVLGRALDSTEFWQAFGCAPGHGRAAGGKL